MVLCIDFDGTCVTHEYPYIGEDIGAVPILQELVDKGHSLILYTMRSGDTLRDAVNWFISNNIFLYGINENPTQSSWTSSPKIYAHAYIDDAAIGIPLLESGLSKRPYVDWVKVRELLVLKGLL